MIHRLRKLICPLLGTIPTLVVPTIETTGPEVTTKYRSLRDTMVSPARAE